MNIVIRKSKTHDVQSRTRGFGLIEILVASAVLSSVLLAVSFFYQNALGVSQLTGERVQAAFLLEEGLEVVKIMRDNSWTDITGLATGIPLYYDWTGTAWATTSANTFVDGFYDRSFILDDVYRDVNDDIVFSGGTLDTNIKRVTVSVSWQRDGATTTRSIASYIADIFN